MTDPIAMQAEAFKKADYRQECELRISALQLAVGAADLGESPETTVARAKAFSNFLMNEGAA